MSTNSYLSCYMVCSSDMSCYWWCTQSIAQHIIIHVLVSMSDTWSVAVISRISTYPLTAVHHVVCGSMCSHVVDSMAMMGNHDIQ